MVFKSVIFILSLTLLSPLQSQTVKDNSAPNVIIILADDLGYKDVSFNGSPDIRTPNIDRIASNGVQFTNAYVSYAVCGPSRAGLITGRYQDRFGFSRNPLFAPKDIGQGLPLSEQTIAEALESGGYRNMAIGKWHLGAHKDLRPLKRGFHEFFGFLSGGHRYFPEELTLADISEVKAQFDPYLTKILRNNDRMEETEYLTDAFSREAVSFVDRNKDQPFFLYLAYNAPHSPLQATQKYLDRYENIQDEKRRTYAAMVSALDDGVGALLNKLEELQIADNTIVFFLSDNGGNEALGSDNGELKKGKGSLYEGGIRVPFAMQWPSQIKKGLVYDHPIISLDIFATIKEYAGVETKNTLDGVNLIPFITGKSKGVPHQELFWRKYDQDFYAVRSGNMKIVQEQGELELYDLLNDIGEESLVKDNAQKEQLNKLYENWKATNVAPAFLGLLEDGQYTIEHPDRFDNVEKY